MTSAKIQTFAKKKDENSNIQVGQQNYGKGRFYENKDMDKRKLRFFTVILAERKLLTPNVRVSIYISTQLLLFQYMQGTFSDRVCG